MLHMVSRWPISRIEDPLTSKDETALGSDGRLTMFGLDGHALFVAGLENLAHWDLLDISTEFTKFFLDELLTHTMQHQLLSNENIP